MLFKELKSIIFSDYLTKEEIFQRMKFEFQSDSKSFVEAFLVRDDDKFGNYLIHYVVESDNPPLLEYVMKACNEIHIFGNLNRRILNKEIGRTGPRIFIKNDLLNLKNNDGETALVVSVSRNYFLAANILLEYPQDVNQVYAKNRTIIFGLTEKYTILEKAIFIKDTRCLKILLEKNARAGGDRAIFLAVKIGNVEAVEMLLDYGISLDCNTGWGRSLLHIAAINGQDRVVKKLLEFGIELDATEHSHNSALHYASAYNYPEIIRLLIRAGANTELRAEGTGYVEGKMFLAPRKYEKYTPLHYAIMANNLEAVSELLSLGANAKARKGFLGIFGDTPLEVCQKLERFEIADILQQHLKRQENSKKWQIEEKEMIITGENNYNIKAPKKIALLNNVRTAKAI